jgi:hypothetical protein
MTTNAFALASNIAMRYCRGPVAAMRHWGFTTPTDTIGAKPGMALDAMPPGLKRSDIDGLVAAALRRKYGTPRAALRAWGLDEALLDDEGNGDPELLAKVLEFLKGKLSPEDMNALTEMVGHVQPDDPEARGSRPRA